jgi:hypothetical protein
MARMSKVERFKRDRAIAAELQALEAAGAGDAAAERDAVAAAGDEERARRLWLLQLEGGCLRALEQRGVLRQEAELLRHAAERQGGSGGASSSGGGGGGAAAARAAAEERELKARMAAQLRGIVGQLESSDRERLRQQVGGAGPQPPLLRPSASAPCRRSRCWQAAAWHACCPRSSSACPRRCSAPRTSCPR